MAGLGISLLGSFVGSVDGRPLQSFRSNRAQALLIYLVTESALGATLHQRESLMTLLWPGLPLKSAQVNLRQVLYQLRQAIPASSPPESEERVDFLLTDRRTVQVNPQYPLELDVAQFIQGLNGPQRLWPDAVALYRGDFLADFYLPDANTFEEWASARRAGFQRQILDALASLSEVTIQEGRYDEAEGYARRQLELDPLREKGYRQLMTLLARDGRRSEALAQYEECRQLLEKELGVEPSARTQALQEAILAGEVEKAGAIYEHLRGYELKESIGTGMFGTVYRAIQPSIGREVAIKTILPRFANDPEFIRRFEAEAHRVAQLEHPFIVPLYDYWREPDNAYLVMRYLKGGSLRSALEVGPWDLRPILKTLDQICSALSIAHQQGIIHRDIKPANILLDEAGNAYLADFGIAKDLGEGSHLTDIGAVVGTPDYISPEQILGKSVSPQTDIYSLGAVLYEMLTGEKPFPDDSVASLMYKHLNEPAPLVSSSRPDLVAQIDVVKIDTVIRRAMAKQPADRFADALEMTEALRNAMPGDDGAVTEIGSVFAERSIPTVALYNPYKGLRAFQDIDAADFFGREALVEQLVGRLSDSRFLAVVGPSGSGKSSAVKAGLIPALRAGAIPPQEDIAGSKKWFVAEMVPGTHPLEELELGLWPIAVDPPPSLVEPMQRDTRGMLRTLRRIMPSEDGAQLLLVIDQFEELFTLVDDDERRAFFIDSLLIALKTPRSPLRVLITLRADFYDRPLQEQSLGKLLKENTEIVLPLTPEELTWAVREPARRVGVGLDQDLVANIVADVVDQPGALPLLQYALTELFERRQDGLMSRGAYEEIGGVLGALGRRADEIYDELEPAGREAARQLFLRLITLGEGVEDTRRRVLRSELDAIGGQLITNNQQLPVSDDQQPASGLLGPMPAVIDAFGAARLLTFDRDPVTRGATVEIAHEALLREWRRLRAWVDESRDDLRLYRLLARAAGEWLGAGREDSYLLRGSRLSQFEGWADNSSITLTENESDFLAAGIAAEEARRSEEEARRRRELEAARKLAETEKARATEQAQSAQRLRKRALLLAIMLSVAVLLAVTSLILGRQAQKNAQLASSERDEAVAAQATTQAEVQIRATAEAIARQESALSSARELSMAAVNNLGDDPELSILLALESFAYTNTIEAENALHWALEDSRVRLRTAAQPSSSDPTVINNVAYHPEGTTIATAGADGVARIWDTATGELRWDLTGHTDFVQDLTYSPDGNFLATAGNDLTARVWDLKTGQAILTLDHPDAVDDVDFSPDGTTLATASYGGGARLWNLETGILEQQFPVEGCIDVSFSPDGELLATTSLQATAQIWELATGEKLHTLRGHEDWVLAATFSPDSRQLATVGMDTGPLIWDVETGELLLTPVNRAPAPDVAYSPDGQQIAVAYTDGNVDVWDLAAFMENSGSEPAVRLAGHESMVSGIAFDPSGRLLATGSQDGTARIWDVSGSGESQTLVHENITEGADFSPDGRYLAIGVYGSGDVIVWDMESGSPAVTLNQGKGDFWATAISPDGQLVAAALFDGTVAVWDLTKPDQVLFKNTEHYADRAWAGGATGIAFSPNGQLLASTGENGAVFLWDTRTWTKQLTITGHGPSATPGIFEGIIAVAFSPDGKWLASGGADGNIMVWDIEAVYTGELAEQVMESGQELFTLSGHQATVMDVDFSPDGRFLASSDFDALANVWDLDAREILFDIRTAASFISDVDFSPDSRFLALASHDGLARVWDVKKQQEWLTLYRAKNGGVCEVAFSPDGTRLVATGCRDRQARTFILSLEELIVLAQSRLTRGLTDDECRQYLHIENCQIGP